MDWIKSEGLSKIRGVVHGFSDRGFKWGMEEAARCFGLGRILTLNQIHSSNVFAIKDGFKEKPKQKGDAIITCLKGTGIGVFTADCVPILFADESSSAVAVVHAGWRGTFSQITNATLLEMKREFGTDPSRVCAVVGPSIGRCCYEVGEDVASLFANKFEDWKTYLFKSDSKYILDLKEANKTALIKGGVKDIELVDVCTKCNSDFHSYRRDGKNVGRQLSFIGLV